MAFNVQILCPNGRRQNIKSSFNATLLQVLEDCCKKQGFLPPEDYTLMHGRTVLDLTLSIRYLNLTNNAKLELVKTTTPRKESEILVALQLSDGTRLQKSFLPQVTLWEIIQYWQKEAKSSLQPFLTTEVDLRRSSCMHPVCIYLREEIAGELALKNTPLRKLGLTGGKAALRLVHREIDNATFAQIKKKIDSEATKNMKLEEIAARHLIEEQSMKTKEAVPGADNSTSEIFMETSEEYGGNVSYEQKRGTQYNKQQKSFQERNVAKEGQVHREIDEKTDVQIKQKMDRETRKKMKLDELEKTKNEKETVSDTDSSSSHTMMEISKDSPASENLPNVQLSEYERNRSSQQKIIQTDQQAKVEEQQKLQEKNFAQGKIQETDNFQIPNRNVLIHNQRESKKKDTTYEDPPDEFFEVTKFDVMNMMADLRKKLREMEDNPLMTKSSRDAKVVEKYMKYKTSIVRIHFPDLFVLQGTFHPNEDVASLYQFVKENLEDSSIPFYLFVSPPKQILKDLSQTLITAKLVPASIVFFGSKVKKAHFLNRKLLDYVVSKGELDNYFPSSEGNYIQEPIAEVFPQASTSYEKPTTSRSSTSLISTESRAVSQQIVPKWFKLGRK